jgi:hypothetical protein
MDFLRKNKYRYLPLLKIYSYNISFQRKSSWRILLLDKTAKQIQIKIQITFLQTLFLIQLRS